MTVDVKSVLKSTQKSSSNLRPDKRKEWMGVAAVLVVDACKKCSEVSNVNEKRSQIEVFLALFI